MRSDNRGAACASASLSSRKAMLAWSPSRIMMACSTPVQRATTWVLFRCVVEGLALINDVNGQQLDRLITDDFISAVRYVPYV